MLPAIHTRQRRPEASPPDVHRFYKTRRWGHSPRRCGIAIPNSYENKLGARTIQKKTQNSKAPSAVAAEQAENTIQKMQNCKPQKYERDIICILHDISWCRGRYMYFQIGRITKLSLNFNIFSSLPRVLTDDKFVFRSDE
jgi:hypothetical protein